MKEITPWNNRRHGPDIVPAYRLVFGHQLASAAGTFVFVSMAKPAQRTFFETYYKSPNTFSGQWNVTFVEYATITLVLNLFVSCIGLLLNMSRHKRKRDTWRAAFIVSAVVSLIGLVIIAAGR
jgi:hypothetical protein